MLYNLHFSSSKCRLFHNATLFGFCITHILNTGVLKLKKKSVAKRLNGRIILKCVQYRGWECAIYMHLAQYEGTSVFFCENGNGLSGPMES